MELLIARRNVWRNPRRTILTVLAIAFASILLIFMVSMQFGTYEVMIDSSVKTRTGHIQVLTQGYHEDMKMRLVIDDPKSVENVLQQSPGIVAYSFRANAFGLLSSEDRTYGGMVTGIDPASEPKVSKIATLIRKGEFLNDKDLNSALIGMLLAKNLKVDVGDELVVLGQGRDGSIAATVLDVKGIFDSGIDEMDRATLYIPLDYFQEVFSMRGGAHEGVIICDSLDRVEEVKAEISTALADMNNTPPLEVLTWDELAPGLMQSIQLDLSSGIIFYIILVIVVAFSILNTFLMTIFERTREFGVLMAIGARPGRLTRMVLLESAILTLMGVILGMILGCATTMWAQSSGIPLGQAAEMMKQYGIPSRIHPKLTLISALVGPLAVTAITILTALIPAMRIRKIQPVQAMHEI